MVRKVLYPAVFVIVALMAGSAFAGWQFLLVSTASPDQGYEYDGRIYMPDGMTLVPEGCLVQFILDTAGDGLDDPLAYFGGDLTAIAAWLNAGADPAAFSDDQLLVAADWNGTSLIGDGEAGPGEILIYPANPYIITNGTTGQVFGWRVWNLTPEGLRSFCTKPGEECWYTTGIEKGAWSQYPGGNEVDPWKIGWPSGAAPVDWIIGGEVGAEVGMYELTGDPFYRSANVLDKHLATCGGVIPEPGTMLLIGGSALLLVLRRKK